MNFNFFASLFNKKTKKLKLTLPDSILVKNLKSICKKNNYKVLQNITLYHHTKNIFIPLLILDPKRGLYIFEHKEWSYSDLENYSLERSSNNENSKDTLAYDKTTSFIREKFNEILHNDGVEIFNFLLTENLSYEDYQHLDILKQKLLPEKSIIFSNSQNHKILSKLKAVKNINKNILKEELILANLLSQYLVLEENKTIYLASDEQIAFIENDNYDIEILRGLSQSGKTTALILKSLLIKLKNKNSTISIIEPTTLSCDKVKSKLLELIEYAIVDIDITSIHVITPDEFQALKKHSQYILCDDANLLEDDFLQYLDNKSHKSQLSLVNPKEECDDLFKLTLNFHHTKIDLNFIEINPFANAMQLLSKYSMQSKNETILCISSNTTKLNLIQDLEFFIKDKAVSLDSSKKLIDQEISSIILSDYSNINVQRADIILLLDIDEISEDELGHVINLANKAVFILHEGECKKILNLKKSLKEKNEKDSIHNGFSIKPLWRC